MIDTNNCKTQTENKVLLEPVFLETHNSIKELKLCTFEFVADIHLIKNENNEVVGAIEYRLLKSNDIYIELLEILAQYQDMGYARSTIEKLKELYPGCRIFGQSLPNEKTKNIWESLGAKFGSCEDEVECPYSSYDECEHYCDHPADYYFSI